MATRDQIREWEAAGEAVRAARKARGAIGTRTGEEVKRLREAANETAVCCADCFAPLAAGQSVTLLRRFVERIPARYLPIAGTIPARDHYLDVPICLRCWLLDLTVPPPWLHHLRGLRLRGREDRPIDQYHTLRRCRCEGCERPLRFVAPSAHWRLRDRCCCEACFRKATLRRANERRRVRHSKIACVRCGTMFVPKQSTAKTCSNRCRQALFRARGSRR
jgi:hypothetical protein